ncbi:helix-turn-helix transcriptional regulator [Heyndrickxia sp. MSNUG]|uniref:helix-turn-helix transcriptional regulator n=1 Tax=Heyndrickxia sp. MSNUG TaxID=3136677 RepID=UPI003C2C8E58
MFSNQLDYWMIKKGIKNTHLAKICKVSEQTFSKWRQNRTQPDIESAAIIAKALHITVDQLIFGEKKEELS